MDTMWLSEPGSSLTKVLFILVARLKLIYSEITGYNLLKSIPNQLDERCLSGLQI